MTATQTADNIVNPGMLIVVYEIVCSGCQFDVAAPRDLYTYQCLLSLKFHQRNYACKQDQTSAFDANGPANLG